MNSKQNLNSCKLQQLIGDRLRTSPQQRITFAEYMDLVLYDPNYGYYGSGTVAFGAEGDFFTSTSVGADLGELLAVQFQQMWHKLNCPHPFTLVEMGAGNGRLAADILNFLRGNYPEFLSALRYIIVEQSPVLRQQQQELLSDWTKINLNWQTLAELPPNSVTGCFFSNELIDAFAVHLVTIADRDLQEIYLTLDEGNLREIVAPLSTPKIAAYFDLIDIDLLDRTYDNGYRTEVNLAALDWLDTIAHKLQQGYILTIDYGYPASRYYSPQRNQGTLQCYYQHRRHHNPYVNLGYQDLTTHVNFTALERQGELSGLERIGFTQQGMFLMALGLGDRLNELSSGKYKVTEILHRRDALHQLINPAGLGGFGVLVQGKGLNAQQQTLLGLTIPSMI